VKIWLDQDIEYSAVWIYDHLKPMGYTGGYEIVKRFVRKIKAERTRIAYLRFETEPGHQAQVDWGEFILTLPDGTTQKLYLFAMILGYSRMLYSEFVERCDLTTFLDCHIRAFDYFGGVPDEILYDRMKNVFIRKLAGKTIFNRSLVSLGLHYGFKPIVSPAYAPWVKGKIERPIAFVREGFWRGYGFTRIERSNRDLINWLDMKSMRVHGTTHEVVRERLFREQPVLGRLPHDVFDTSYTAFRTVYKDCCVRFETNRYMVPHTLVGQHLVLRIKNKVMRIFRDDEIIVTYEIPDKKGQFIFEQKFIDALKNDREMNLRKYGRSGQHRKKGRAFTISPTLPAWAVDVEIRSLNVYDLIPVEQSDIRKEVV
jgi:transposase